MKTKAAVLRKAGQDWEVTELELDPPKEGEVLIRYVAAGLCHSDEHLRHGDLVPRFPCVGGHEGAGILEEVGPGGVGLKAWRPHRVLLHPLLRPLPLLLDRTAEPLRPGRDGPGRRSAFRWL